METATLYVLAAKRGVQAGSLLVVSDLILPERARISPEALQEAEHRMGEAALRGLAGQPVG
jgi:purine-nucleoside phosphorylase